MTKLLSIAIVLLAFISGALAAESASATLSWTQNGSNFTYTITLTNTGTTDIGTFWYAWSDLGENFLPSSPSSTNAPSGWASANITNNGSGDGFGVQWLANTALAPGQSVTGFQFTTTSTPSAILGNSPFYPGTPVGTSFIYHQGPFSDGGFEFTVTAASAQVSQVSLSTNGVVGGNTVTGIVTLSAAAGSGGLVVNLSSDNAGAATVPASVTVASGKKTANFTVTTRGVDAAATAHISGAGGGATKSSPLIVNPAALSSIGAATTIIGGNNLSGSVSLNGKAGPSGKIVSLASGTPAVIALPTSAAVAAQAGSAPFTGTTHAVGIDTTVTLSARIGTGTTKTAQVTVKAPVISVIAGASSMVGGNSATITPTLTGIAPTGGFKVTFTTDNSAVAPAPAAVTILAGHTTAAAKLSTLGVSVATVVHIGVSGSTKKLTLDVVPASLVSVTLSSTSAFGGIGVTATAHLNGKNGNAAKLIATSSANTAAAVVSAGTSLGAQASSAGFAVTTKPVAASTLVSLKATYNGVSKTVSLLVRAATVTKLGFLPSPVIGGQSATGTVTLSSPAPSGGLVVHLSHTGSADTVPTTVTVTAGKTQATFTVTTKTVSTSTTDTISAEANSSVAKTTLTINP